MIFTIHIDFFNKNGISHDQADSLLKQCKNVIDTYKNEADGHNIWRFMWKYNEFNITEVSKRVIELMKVLDDYELNKN